MVLLIDLGQLFNQLSLKFALFLCFIDFLLKSVKVSVHAANVGLGHGLLASECLEQEVVEHVQLRCQVIRRVRLLLDWISEYFSTL